MVVHCPGPYAPAWPFPVSFTPVEINGHLLADGGMVENIPVEVAREMDADKVIAVDLQMPLGGHEQLETLTGVLSRAVSVMILQNERQSLKLADATVTVDTGNFSMTDYDRVPDLIRLGYRSAANQAAVLLPYAITYDAEWQQYLAARNARRRPQPEEVQSVTVKGGDSDTNSRIERRLKSDKGVPLNLKKFETQLTRIAGEGEFDRLGYEGFMQDGVPVLRVTAHEKTYGPPFVDLAVNVDGSGVAAFDFSAGVRVTFMDVEHHGGEWRNDLMLGSSNLAATEFYQPIANTHFFVAPYAFASKLPRNAFDGQTRVAVFGDERAGGGFDLGYDSGTPQPASLWLPVIQWETSAADRQLPACPRSAGAAENFVHVMSGTAKTVPRFPAQGHPHRCQPGSRAAKPRPCPSHRSARRADFHLHSLPAKRPRCS
jgi:NTE family protein